MRFFSLAIAILPAPSLAALDIPKWLRANDSVSFDHEVCETAVREYLESSVSSTIPLDLIFIKGPNNALLMGDDNMTITIQACEQLCGHRNKNWYIDRGPRLMT